MRKPPKKLTRKLAAEWNRKLKASGFEDIEDARGRLLKWTCVSGREDLGKKLWAEQARDYYRIAGFFLHDHQFETEIEKKVWELHSQGEGYRVIMDRLNLRQGLVRKVLTKLVREMKLYYRTDFDDEETDRNNETH